MMRERHHTEPELVRLPLATEDLRIKREVVLAVPLGGGKFVIHSIPAFVYGLGLGDTIELLDPKVGSFQVVARGGQVTIRVFVQGSLDRPDIQALVSAVTATNGKFEVGKNDESEGGSSLLLVSVPIVAGLAPIRELMRAVEGPDVEWEYGNVYGDNGQPLNWWSN